MVFINLEQAYERVLKEILWKALEKKRVHIAYIQAMNDMYDETIISVRTLEWVIEDLPIKINLHQRSSLSLYFFTLVLGVLTRHIQDVMPKYMLFIDYIVLVEES